MSVRGPFAIAAACAIFFAPFAAGTSALAEEPTPAADVFDADALLHDLRSDDAEIREKATVIAARHALKCWERLKPLAEGGDPELRERLRRAMAQAATALLPKWLEQAQQEFATHETYKMDFKWMIVSVGSWETDRPLFEGHLKQLKEEEQALRARLQELLDASAKNNLPENERVAAAQRIRNENKPALESLAVRLTLAQKAIEIAQSDAKPNARNEALKEIYLKMEKGRQTEALRLFTRLAQLQQLRAAGGLKLSYRADMLDGYDPRLVPFETRLTLSVKYEDLEQTFADAMKRIGAWSGVEIELSAKIPQDVLERAKADMRVTQQDVRSLVRDLASMLDLECRIDAEAQRIVLAPKEK